MIDAVSLKILKILQKKARIPNVEVARQVGMAPSAVLERIRKLEKQGFIAEAECFEVHTSEIEFWFETRASPASITWRCRRATPRR